MPLDARTRTLLVKLLGLVGSQHDGEALAAARKAHQLVRDAGLTWHEVVEPGHGTAMPMLWREPAPGDHLDAIAICLLMPNAPLSPWDRKFLISISQRPDITHKQQVQLDRILDACRAHACCAA